MKKLNKLQINSEKLMNNEELITLKGGYGECWECAIFCPGQAPIAGQGCGPGFTWVIDTCNALWGPAGCFCDCNGQEY